MFNALKLGTLCQTTTVTEVTVNILEDLNVHTQSKDTYLLCSCTKTHTHISVH